VTATAPGGSELPILYLAPRLDLMIWRRDSEPVTGVDTWRPARLRRPRPLRCVRRNIAFGHGEHFCPGASLARTEVRISLERLLARLDDLQLVDPSAISYAPSFLIRGLNDLPLRFRRRS